jgi:hypothetical protein
MTKLLIQQQQQQQQMMMMMMMQLGNQQRVAPTFHPSWYDDPTKRFSNPRKQKGREEVRRTIAKVFPHLESPPTKDGAIDEDEDAWNDIITSPLKDQSPDFKDQYYYI